MNAITILDARVDELHARADAAGKAAYDAAYDHHFALWQSEGTPADVARIRARISARRAYSQAFDKVFEA